MTNNFTRSNVDLKTLEVSAPNRSSFDLSKNSMQSIPFGILYPTRCTKLIPSSTIKGSVNPNLQLEKFATPAAGRMRLDTHSFVVSSRRIHNQFRQYVESSQTGRTVQSLPSFHLTTLVGHYFRIFTNYWGTTQSPITTLEGLFDYFKTSYVPYYTGAYTPSFFLREALNRFQGVMPSIIAQSTFVASFGNIQDYFTTEKQRLSAKIDSLPIDDWKQDMSDCRSDEDYYLGDFIYDLLFTCFGEGSTLDQLGYPIINYFGSVRETLNRLDYYLRTDDKPSTGNWLTTTLDAWIDHFSGATLDKIILMNYDDTQTTHIAFFDRDTLYPLMSEMPLRANYAVWFDFFRNWHLDPESSCLNPDDFSGTSLFATTASLRGIQLLVPRKRNWSRDAFTMVQPDDVYRHVYAPAIDSHVGEDVYHFLQSDEFAIGFDYVTTQLANGSFDNIQLKFPSFATNLFGSNDNLNVFYHDLQTMRRAEMLRHKLTRDYYNPDTYVGQMEARYAIKPVDFSILVSQYIGGNESMINGSQQIANMQTTDTKVGQRTLVADAACSDSFTYNTTEHAYLLNYVSIVPLVHYDALNPNLLDIKATDQVVPEYANDNQVMIRTCDLLRDFFKDGSDIGLGYVPRYYGHRIALDDVHGKYLREYRSYTWLRDKYNVGVDAMLTKNALNEHINMPLDCFMGLKPWDTIAFGSIDMPLYVDAPLPAKLEVV